MKSARLNGANILSNIANFACWMKCWTRLSQPSDPRLSTLQLYVVCKSQIDIGHTFMEISLNLANFTDFFLNRNVIPFYFHFSSKHAFSLTYSVRCLRLKNYVFSRFFLCGQLNRLKDTKRNVLDFAEFRNQVLYRKFLRE